MATVSFSATFSNATSAKVGLVPSVLYVPPHGGSFSAKFPSSSKMKSDLTVSTPLSGPVDMIITDITWSPSSPVPGDHVVFSAVVQNIGGSPWPAGTILDVLFEDPDSVSPLLERTWSDDQTAALAPGASRTQTANGGNTPGVNYWVATLGTFTIQATVNSNHRYPEATEANNVFTKPITIGVGPPRIPDAPSVMATPGNATVGLTWGAPANNGSAITTYRVYRNGTLIASPTSLVYIDNAVVNGTTYSYTVSAINGVGEGPQSTPQLAQPFSGGNVPALLSPIVNAVPASRLITYSGVGPNFTSVAEAATWKDMGFGGVAVVAGGNSFTENDPFVAPYRNDVNYWGQRYIQGGDAWGGGAPTAPNTANANFIKAMLDNGMEAYLNMGWRATPPSYVPALGDYWNDANMNGWGDKAKQYAGAIGRVGGHGLMWDMEHDHYAAYDMIDVWPYTTPITSANRPSATVAGQLIREQDTGNYYRCATPGTWTAITKQAMIDKIEQRGYEHGLKLFTQFPACQLVFYEWRTMPGGIFYPIHGFAIDTWLEPSSGKEWYMWGIMRGMKDANGTGFMLHMESEYYHGVETQASNMTHDNAAKYNLQGILSQTSQRLPGPVRDFIMDKYGSSPFDWAGTDGTGYYDGNQQGEPSYTDGLKRARRWGMFGRHFEFTFGATNESGSWGSPRGVESANSPIAPNQNIYTWPAGRHTGMVAATSTTPQSTTAPVISAWGQSRSGNTVTLTIDARHEYGIRNAHWKLFAGDGITIVGQGQAVMYWDHTASGSTYTSLNFGGVNPTDFMHCVCAIPNATAGLYVTVDVYSCVGQRVSQRFQMV